MFKKRKKLAELSHEHKILILDFHLLLFKDEAMAKSNTAVIIGDILGK
jgi:hypothetical protein